jgi:ketosteroid isomerase-like protein
MIRTATCGIIVLLAGAGWANRPAAPDNGAVPEPAAGDDDADHAALRALVPEYEQAVNDGKPELLQPYLDSDFSGVMITGDEVDSFVSLEQYWASIQSLMGDGGKYRVKVHVAARSILSGDLAVSYGTTDDEVVTSRGKEYHFTGRWTAVCRKRDGKWKILRVHGSMDPVTNPFVLATVRSASISAGAVAGMVGLLVGWFVHNLVARRRKAAASR